MAAPIYSGGRPFIKPGDRIKGGDAPIARFSGSGAPSGTTGLNFAGKSSLYFDYTNGAVYLNVGTAASPSWAALSVEGGGAQAAAVQATPADPTAATSATYVMAGCAVAITPALSGRLMIVISGDLTGVNGATVTAQASYGTGVAPANGAAVTGTQVGNQPFYTALTADLTSPFTVNAIVTGLVIGTALWLDIAFKSSTGAASVSKLSFSAHEI